MSVGSWLRSSNASARPKNETATGGRGVSASRPLDRGQRRILGTASIADNRLFVRDADATAFLNALEPSPRALICTVVYAVIRGGVTDPQRVLAEVTARLQERGRDPRVPP